MTAMRPPRPTSKGQPPMFASESELLDALCLPRGPSMPGRLLGAIDHRLRGCCFRPKGAFDLTSGRVVQVGWLCPQCGRESDLGGHR